MWVRKVRCLQGFADIKKSWFSIYLSKINPENTATRKVRFKLEDFQNIMDLGRLNIEYMKNITDSLLSKVVSIPNEFKGYDAFQLFKECRIAQEKTTE